MTYISDIIELCKLFGRLAGKNGTLNSGQVKKRLFSADSVSRHQARKNVLRPQREGDRYNSPRTTVFRSVVSIAMTLMMVGGSCVAQSQLPPPPRHQPGQSEEQFEQQQTEWQQQREYANRQLLAQRAQKGDANAAFALGNSYAYPIYLVTGLKPDFKRGADWYLYATLRGSVPAAYMLGELYFNGQGVTKDHKQAYLMISWAANHGYEPAKNFLRTSGGTDLLKELGQPFNPAWKSTETPPQNTNDPGADLAKTILLTILGAYIFTAVVGTGNSQPSSDHSAETGMYSDRCKNDSMAAFFGSDSVPMGGAGRPLSCNN